MDTIKKNNQPLSEDEFEEYLNQVYGPSNFCGKEVGQGTILRRWDSKEFNHLRDTHNKCVEEKHEC